MGLLVRTIFIAAVVIAALAAAGLSGAAAAMGPQVAGKALDGFAVPARDPAPKEIRLNALDGKAYELKDPGRVVLLHFWASWCAPCMEEMPALKRLGKDLKDMGLTVLMVAEDSRKNARVFAEEHKVPLPVLIDQYGAAMRAYGVKAIPSSVVIGRDGAIKAYIIGQRDYGGPEARAFFEKILEEP